MNNKITIIEGPPPTFVPVSSDWAASIDETPEFFHVMATDLRTMNGRGLIERCYQTWSQQETMFLRYKNRIGLIQEIPILAAQNIDTEEGEKLVLWVRAKTDEVEEPPMFEEDN